MNIQNIKDIFEEISGLKVDKVNDYKEMAENAKAFIERKLIKSDLTTLETKMCEYACAAIAYYDYIMMSVSKGNRTLTRTGIIHEEDTSNNRLLSAKGLRDEALMKIADLLDDVSFVFMSVRG